MPGGVSFFWKVKRTLGVAEEGGPSASAIYFFFWKYHQNGGEKSAMN